MHRWRNSIHRHTPFRYLVFLDRFTMACVTCSICVIRRRTFANTSFTSRDTVDGEGK